MEELSPKGKLEVIVGPVFSGKTSELIRRLQRYHFAGYKCLIICFSKNVECTKDSLNTYDDYKLNTLITSKLLSIQHFAAEFDVIGIDEAHYFTDIGEFCLNASESGKKVIVAALDGNYERQGFPHILGLIPLAENLNKLTSICMNCSNLNEAPFTKKISTDSSEVEEGENHKFISVCQDCYFLPISKKNVSPNLTVT